MVGFFALSSIFINKHEMKEFIKNRLNEELTKSDVNREIDKVLDSNALSDKVAKIVKDKIKNDPDLEKFMVDISKNVLAQLYKTLWTKRNFWQSSLKNKES